MTEEKKKTEKPVKGSYAIDSPNKKVEIQPTPNETHGVLFEDISSISIKKELYTEDKHEPTIVSNIGMGVLLIAVVVFFSGLFTDENLIGIGIGLGLISFVLIGAGMKTNKIVTKWDKVTVETRGGKHLSYYVEEGQGKKDVNAIEQARRG